MNAPRTYLFVPGNRPERFAKALASGADAIVLDLEDAVAPTAKGEARDAIAQWSRQAAEADRARIVVRINDAQSSAFADDLQLLRDARLSHVDAAQGRIRRPRCRPFARPCPHARVLALIESARGVAHVAAGGGRRRRLSPGLRHARLRARPRPGHRRQFRGAGAMPPARWPSPRVSRASPRRSPASRPSSTTNSACWPTSRGRAAMASAPSCASTRARSRPSTPRSRRARRPSPGRGACWPPRPRHPAPPSSTAA